LAQLADKLGIRISCLYLVEATTRSKYAGGAIDKLASLHKQLALSNPPIKLCTSWAPSANLSKQIQSQGSASEQLKSLFVNELTFDLKNGLSGGRILPLSIIVDGQNALFQIEQICTYFAQYKAIKLKEAKKLNI